MVEVYLKPKFNIDQIIDSLINGVIVTDLKGDIIYCNKSFLKMIKYKDFEDVNNKNIIDFFSHSEVFKITDLSNIINQSGKDTSCFKIRCMDGSYVKSDIKLSSLEDKQGQRFAWVMSFNDISNYDNIKEDLQKKEEELKKLRKQKDDFIWQLGHDLKTPISPITTLLPIIERNISEPRQKDMIKKVIENSNILKEEINKILETAKTKPFGTNNEFENISLSTLIDEIISENIELLDKKNIVVDNEINSDISVYANKENLRKVFNQLISNSITYSKQNSNITIFADYDIDFVKIEFKDSGSGMSQDKIDHIFDEFYKIDESRHDLKTSGLGLPIIKRIIEKNGGHIFAQSTGIDMGLSFYISLKKA